MYLELIQSKDNQLIKEVKKLKEKRYREEQGKFFIEGCRFVEEAFKAGADVEKLLISQKHSEKYINIFQSAVKVSLHVIKDSLFNDICDTEAPQGIAAIIRKKTYNTPRENGLFVLVDKVQDPGNLGTIIRTAHAASAKGIIYTAGTVDPYNEKTLRSTMGSIFYVPIIEDKNLQMVASMKEVGYKVVASSLDAEENFFARTYGEKVIIAVGNEGKGISEEVYALADIRVKIPMPGGAESLNASVAASIMIYEVLRQNLK
ncbi:TrmH family RNA methyltransferase [Clostridium thermarum]|uniref:TrmH family RNA methyltransferase n=1 Tax=Clostridium thermarum TaxID=1716543 RepID=UPI0013D29A0C|nr:RNA methyltransferase [Clostridium thermarum]